MGFLERVFGGLKPGLAPFLPQPRREGLTLEEALPRLVPKVRPRFLYESLALKDAAACPVFRTLGGSHGLSLAVDAPTWERNVKAADLESWQADFDALLQHARANLARRGGEDRFELARPGLFRSTWHDNLDGSRLLLPGVIRRLPLRGGAVAVCPDRDTLLVAGSEDEAALAWLLEAARQGLWEDPRSAGGCPLQLQGFEWRPWEAPEGHPASGALAKATRRRLLVEYTHQKDILDQVLGRSGRDVTVAPLHLEVEDSGAMASCTFLPLGAREGWLPLADRVGVPGAHRRGEWLWVPWQEVLDQAGHLLEPVGLYPERYRIRIPEALAVVRWQVGRRSFARAG